MSPAPSSADRLLARLRRLLLALVAFGAGGLALEPVLLAPWEAWTQRVPLALLLAAFAGAVGLLVRPGPRLWTGFRTVMVLAVLSGAVGSVLHYRGNAALEREIAPNRPAVEIVRAALTGGIPTLAPGAMIQLGLLGLLAGLRATPRRHDAPLS